MARQTSAQKSEKAKKVRSDRKLRREMIKNSAIRAKDAADRKKSEKIGQKRIL